MDKTETATIWEAAGKFLTGLILFVVGATVRGFVVMMLWNWFIVPLGVANLTFWWAMGIGVTATTLINASKSGKADEDKGLIMTMVVGSIGSFAVLGLAAIIHLFM